MRKEVEEGKGKKWETRYSKRNKEKESAGKRKKLNERKRNERRKQK